MAPRRPRSGEFAAKDPSEGSGVAVVREDEHGARRKEVIRQSPPNHRMAPMQPGLKMTMKQMRMKMSTAARERDADRVLIARNDPRRARRRSRARGFRCITL